MTYSAITPDIIQRLKNGEVVVMPTDTIYGLVGSALQPETVERIYRIKNRPADKPCIVLIPRIESLQDFGITLTPAIARVIQNYWPGPTSLAFPINPDQFSYLHRGTNYLAFRLPNNNEIVDLLSQTGPLIATSANATGRSPATSVEEAQTYFNNSVDAYVDGGTINASPSELLRVENDGSTTVLRA